MTAPLINLGITSTDIQDFELKYAAAWAQIPSRLLAVMDVLNDPRTSGAGKAGILAATQNLQAQYAATSGNLGVLLQQMQMNSPVDIGLATQTLPAALAVLAGTDQVEQAVGLSSGVQVSASVPWYLYLLIGVPLYFVFNKKKGRRK